MKNKFITFIGFTFITFITLALPFFAAHAQAVPTCPEGTYCALSTIPGITQTGKPADPTFIITNIYGISIGIAAILAIGMIIWAGIQYATTEAISGKSEAKKHWQGAVFGLLLLLGSYLILKTINVDLVNQDLSLGNPIGCVEEISGKRVPCGGGAEDAALNAARAQVQAVRAQSEQTRINLEKAKDLAAAKQIELDNAKNDPSFTGDLDLLQAEANNAQVAKNAEEKNFLRLNGLAAIGNNIIGQSTAFENAAKKSSITDMAAATESFKTNVAQNIVAMSNLKTPQGDAFTPEEIANIQQQYSLQIQYMDSYTEWTSILMQTGKEPYAKPVKPVFQLTPQAPK